ncbi:hypothetical protein N7495_007401 [Penicillium taxi]|uniref:uncharacterized protein n=1 Tax=Penicillium taxi TaxID=168475 RepID=UPI002545945E|nr:uncharacterized protein N7495_007401 [Penicillium taxi]KAJ5887360.1 hypothetical protein N7495_007401 [Penicillium taxi]
MCSGSPVNCDSALCYHHHFTSSIGCRFETEDDERVVFCVCLHQRASLIDYGLTGGVADLTRTLDVRATRASIRDTCNTRVRYRTASLMARGNYNPLKFPINSTVSPLWPTALDSPKQHASPSPRCEPTPALAKPLSTCRFLKNGPNCCSLRMCG